MTTKPISVKMTHEQFCIWLHGFLEISGAKKLNETQTQIVKDHLDLFFKKVAPEREELDLGDWTVPNVFPEILGPPAVQCTCLVSPHAICPVHGQWGGATPQILC